MVSRAYEAPLRRGSALTSSGLIRSGTVQPLTSYRNTNVLGGNEKYYLIGNYEVVRERGEMKIIGIRFFTRLF